MYESVLSKPEPGPIPDLQLTRTEKCEDFPEPSNFLMSTSEPEDRMEWTFPFHFLPQDVFDGAPEFVKANSKHCGECLMLESDLQEPLELSADRELDFGIYLE